MPLIDLRGRDWAISIGRVNVGPRITLFLFVASTPLSALTEKCSFTPTTAGLNTLRTTSRVECVNVGSYAKAEFSQSANVDVCEVKISATKAVTFLSSVGIHVSSRTFTVQSDWVGQIHLASEDNSESCEELQQERLLRHRF